MRNNLDWITSLSNTIILRNSTLAYQWWKDCSRSWKRMNPIARNTPISSMEGKVPISRLIAIPMTIKLSYRHASVINSLLINKYSSICKLFKGPGGATDWIYNLDSVSFRSFLIHSFILHTIHYLLSSIKNIKIFYLMKNYYFDRIIRW